MPDIIPLPLLGIIKFVSVAWFGESDIFGNTDVPSMFTTFDCSAILGEEIFEASVFVSVLSSLII